MTDSRFVVNQEEFDKAGLIDVGFYLWKVESVKGTVKKYEYEGQTIEYPIIQMRLAATKTVATDDEGNVIGEVELENNVTRPFEEFKLKGRGARKLRTLYQAVTGRPLTGGDGETVNVLAAAEELLGGEAWNNIFHASYTRDDNTVGWKDMLTNTFKSKAPKKIQVAKKEE